MHLLWKKPLSARDVSADASVAREPGLVGRVGHGQGGADQEDAVKNSDKKATDTHKNSTKSSAEAAHPTAQMQSTKLEGILENSD